MNLARQVGGHMAHSSALVISGLYVTESTTLRDPGSLECVDIAEIRRVDINLWNDGPGTAGTYYWASDLRYSGSRKHIPVDCGRRSTSTQLQLLSLSAPWSWQVWRREKRRARMREWERLREGGGSAEDSATREEKGEGKPGASREPGKRKLCTFYYYFYGRCCLLSCSLNFFSHSLSLEI